MSIPLVIFFWCMFEGLRYTTALNAGALYTIIPAITAIFTSFINREFSTKRRIAGLTLGTLGALWIVFRGDLQAVLNLNLNRGDLIFLVGCLFMGIYNPLVKRFYSGEPMEVMTFWVILFGSVWLLVISGASLGQVEWYIVENKVYIGVLYLSVFTTLISFFLVQYGTVKIGATGVAAYSFMTPVFVIFLGAFVGFSDFEWLTLPGIILVITAMRLIQSE